MKRTILTACLALVAAAALTACEQKTVEQRVDDQLGKVYALKDTERALAEANAKRFFEQPWAPAGGKTGQFIGCRPSDSNANGFVTCTGFVPQPNGGFAEIKRYCGYRPDLVGCSDEDTVKP